MSKSIAANPSGGDNKAPLINQRTAIIPLFVGAAVSCLFLYHTAYPFEFLPRSSAYDVIAPSMKAQKSNRDPRLEKILKKAAMVDNTVIITTLNQAWAEPNSIFDIFLESFRTGNGTGKLLDHLVVVSLDSKALNHCLSTHPHCYALNTSGLDFSGKEAYFMTSGYLEMMWIRIRLLSDVLAMGYNFVFTDADIVWLQNPFQHFDPDADFQIACDRFSGNSFNLRNEPNGGFNYVKSNNRTIEFYKFWYNSRKIFPGLHDQDVLNKIKFDPYIQKIRLKIRFLDTKYIAGFCQVSQDFNAVCTMHANCCFGLEAKITDLRLTLEDWRNFMELPPDQKSLPRSWSVPKKCRETSFHPADEGPNTPPPAVPKISGQEGSNQ